MSDPTGTMSGETEKGKAMGVHMDTSISVGERIAGVLVGTACGDALGAGYEFESTVPQTDPVAMVGGGLGNWAPGEWTDDTSMAIAIAEVAASGLDLRDADAQDQVARRWLAWLSDAKDVGTQTRAILESARDEGTAAAVATAARQRFESGLRSAGNGSLMRTAPVAMAYLEDPAACAEAARAISDLTHADPDAGDACVLWSLAIRHAILNAEFNVWSGLDLLPAGRRDEWAQRLTVAETSRPVDFGKNTWVVEALQAAWSAISNTAIPDDEPASGRFAAQHFQLALESAVRGGRDTDTVAAIAGGLLGARWGVSAVPLPWQRILHGWPGMRYGDLLRLSRRPGSDAHGPDRSGYAHLTKATVHPHHDKVILGSIHAAPHLSPEVTAAVSMCATAPDEAPPGVRNPQDHVNVWILDSANPDKNPNLLFVLDQVATLVAELTAEGHTVFLHCAAGQSRTPTAAAIVGARTASCTPREALDAVLAALPDPRPNEYFVQVIDELS